MNITNNNQNVLDKITISVAMITTDRSPKGNHLAHSIQSLKRSGLFEHPNFEFHLFHSGANQKNIEQALAIYPHLNIVQSYELMHINLAAIHAFDIALKDKPDLVMFMEDDIEVCDDFPEFVLDAIAAHGLPNTLLDMVTYYSEVVDAYFFGKQYITMSAQSFYGNQCFILSQENAFSFSAYIRTNHPNKAGFFDTWIADWLIDAKQEPVIACSVPSPAQHTGKNSNQDHEFVQAPCFIGDVEQITPQRTENYVHLASEDKESSFLFSHIHDQNITKLNQSAYLIYLFCDGQHTLKQIIDRVHAETGGSRYALSADIRQGLANLQEQGFLTPYF